MIRPRFKRRRQLCHRAGYFAPPLRWLPLIARRRYLVARSVATCRGGESGDYYYCPGPGRWRKPNHHG